MKSSVVSAKRKNDAVISVSQDNSKKKVIINNANHAAQKLVGILESELVNKAIDIILPKHIQSLVEGYLDFEGGTSDLASVLRRIPDFHILNKEGESVPVSLKVFHMTSANPKQLKFEMLMRDTTLLKNIEELKKALIHQKNEIASDNALEIRRDYVEDTIYLVTDFVVRHHLEASFAGIAIDNIGGLAKKYGKGFGYEVIANVKNVIERTCRSEDIIEYLGQGYIGLIMIDCNSSNAQLVLNRIRLNLKNSNFKILYNESETSLSPNLSMGFTEIKGNLTPPELIDSVINVTKHAQKSGGNKIIEVS